MKKIFVNKNDDPALVVENILAEDDNSIVLVIPKFSLISDSVANFHLLKREAEADDKSLMIESVDDDALALASAAKIPGVNPFLSGRKHNMSDIIPPEVSSSDSDSDFQAEISAPELVDSKPETQIDFTTRDRRHSRRPRLRGWKGLIRLAVGAGILVPALWATASFVIPTVSVTLDLSEYDWEYNEPITASSDITEVVASQKLISSQVFIEKKNATLNPVATGEKEISEKARGKVIIYNAFSSEPQPLVATTRLLTPDGKLFRLVDRLTVPAASIEDGEIIPSSIEAEVIADKPGSEYNVGPVSRFSIPGFQGTSKYQGFYAESSEPMSGGFVGLSAYPVDSDILNAGTELKEVLEDSLKTLSLSSLPEGFRVLPEATMTTVGEITVDPKIVSDNKFTVFGEAELKAIAFKESQLENLLQSSIVSEFGFPADFKSIDFNFSEVVADFNNSTLSFKPGISAKISRQLDLEELKNQLKGKSTNELKSFLISLSGVENARVSFWPFWVDRVPADSSKIRVIINE